MTKNTRRRRCLTALASVGALTFGSMAGLAGSASATDAGLGYDPAATKGSMWHISAAVKAHDSYRAGFTGKGIGIALIDTGVTTVPGLDTGNVWHGPDLSFDSQDPELARQDAYGHGTHLASIIAGRDVAGTATSYTSQSRFNGIAPDANLVSVKVGASDGAVDVSQVIAAIDWVVAHRNDNGQNIRVINLSYGTDSLQDTAVDPLVYAVERAWAAGIVVVVAGGNDGSSNLNLANPARSGYVIAAGASDTRGTLTHTDDLVPAWGTRGTNQRHVDVVAPGVSVLGLRVPNGYSDARHGSARIGSRFAKASGTSQAAAVVSGQAALLLQRYPTMKPDQVKRQLMSTARPFDSATNQYRGNGLTDVRAAQVKAANTSAQSSTFFGKGTGSLEKSRGSSHVNDGVSNLTGEVDIFGRAWNGATWANLAAARKSWSGGQWRGATWSGDSWSGRTWRGVVWDSGTWSARSWRDGEWSARSWRDGAWTARSWRDANWSARSWRTADLASAGWLAFTWR